MARLQRLVRGSPGRHVPDAQNSLASLYHSGVGVTVDLAEAVRLYTLAARQGHAMAQFNLGVRHFLARSSPF